MKGRHKVFDIEIYRKKLIIVDTEDPGYIRKLLTNVEYDDEEVYGHTIYDDWKGYSGIFLIVNSKHPRFNLSVIVHEAIHVKNIVFYIIGHEIDLNNDEPEAYLTEAIFHTAYEYIYGKNQ